MKMLKNSLPLLLLVLVCLPFAACEKEPGPGGKAEIKGVCAHHTVIVPFTKVYIKYDATSSPGTDPSAYDDSTATGADAAFSFSGLTKGAYYVYGIGYDSIVSAVVTAGVPVVITEEDEIEEIILPVTE